MVAGDKSGQSYVFSQETLRIALEQWVNKGIQKASEKEEPFLIVQAALPWLMVHLNQVQNICSFTDVFLMKEIEVFKSYQLADYPLQKDRIEETCDLLVDFFHSDIVVSYKMVMKY